MKCIPAFMENLTEKEYIERSQALARCKSEAVPGFVFIDKMIKKLPIAKEQSIDYFAIKL